MKEIMDILSPLLGEELASAIIDHRKRTVKKPLTAYAAQLQAKEYIKTGDPIAAAEMQILRGWQAIKSEWYFNELEKQNRQQRGTSARRTVTDAARDLEAFFDDSSDALGVPRIRAH